jgi:hypothetical protein
LLSAIFNCGESDVYYISNLLFKFNRIAPLRHARALQRGRRHVRRHDYQLLMILLNERMTE